MNEKKRSPPDKYEEGARGHCYWCGRPEKEHRKGECPDLRERNDVTGRRPQRQVPDHLAVGIVR